MAVFEGLPWLLKVFLKFVFMGSLLITLKVDFTVPEDGGVGMFLLAERSVGILGCEEMNTV
jgi:hypothetical protein